ncbi:hypothetical protein IEC97_12835 [Neobacillus cucumis]|uniref:hypothetical protein n=1 Tax=Neobacillus cucumis TaxID=1740721 RepID=UPI0018DF9803|nr:hypothetical protein [Neobacillus cucumis]MBI0578249.1 hypothetical protein [Neobacillus cucumis]
MSNKTNQPNFTATLRQEFSFYANDETLNMILRDIAAQGVTIIAFTINKLDMGNVNFVRMVVGPLSSNSSRANSVARDALRSAGVRFHQEEVIQIIVTPAPGILSRILHSLFHHVVVFAAYSGANSIILNVSNNQTALKLLKQDNIIR